MQFTNWPLIHPLKSAALIFAIFIILYGSTIPAYNVGYADSDEFLALAPHWGIAHSPGYSLYTGILWLAMKLPLPLTTPTFRAHAASAVAAALTLALGYLVILKLSKLIIPTKSRHPAIFILTAIIAIIAAAVSRQIWLYAQITEKYLFGAPFVMSMILIQLHLMSHQRFNWRLLVGFGLTYGLALMHHQSLVFLAPYYLLTIALSFKSNKSQFKKWALSSLGLIIGIVFSGLLLFAQIQRQSNLPLSWYSGDGLTGLINHLIRKDFQGELYLSQATTNGYIPTITADTVLNGITAYFNQLGQAFSWWIFIPLIIGIISLFSQSKSFRWLIALPFLLLGPVLSGYLGWPQDIGTQAITQRFYLISYFCLIPVVFLGLYHLYHRLYQALKIMQIDHRISTGLSLLPIAFLVYQSLVLYPQVSLKHFDLVSRLYHTILSEVEPNSLVTCYSDTSCFALLYEQSVNKLRPDVQVFPMAYPLVHNQLSQANLQRFTYTNNPFKIFDAISYNLTKRPVYTVDLNMYYLNLFGINNGFIYYLPQGYKARLDLNMPQTLPDYDYTITRDYLDKPLPSFDLYRQFLIESLAQTQISNAFIHLKRGERLPAQALLNQAADLSTQLLPQQNANVQAARLNIEQTMPDQRFSPNITAPNADTLLAAIPGMLQTGRNAAAYAAVLGALMIEPESVPARLELAKIYERGGDREFALLEYSHILLLDPQHATASANINRLTRQ
jgi:tetratricopeptide (TPR) repeat protein